MTTTTKPDASTPIDEQSSKLRLLSPKELMQLAKDGRGTYRSDKAKRSTPMPSSSRQVKVYPCCDGALLHREMCLLFETRERIQQKMGILMNVKAGRRGVWFGYRDALAGVLL